VNPLSKIVTVWTALFAVGSGATALAELRDGGQAMCCAPVIHID
jgi:hypothetical protein